MKISKIYSMVYDSDKYGDNGFGEIAKESLSKIYSKLQTEVRMRSPIAVITSLGENSWNVNIRFFDEDDHGDGKSWDNVYHI